MNSRSSQDGLFSKLSRNSDGSSMTLSVRRDAFLGPGPWPILRWGRGYQLTPSRDPVYLYQDTLVGIVPERHLNNGQPSLHALLISAATPRSSEHVVQIGAGVGYYTAILAHMVGENGRVTAVEFDSGLAGRLAANFAGQPHVCSLRGDGAEIEFDPADVIYVNAGRPGRPTSGLTGS